MSDIKVIGRGIYLHGVRVGVVIEDAQPSMVEEFKKRLTDLGGETRAYCRGYDRGRRHERKKWEADHE